MRSCSSRPRFAAAALTTTALLFSLGLGSLAAQTPPGVPAPAVTPIPPAPTPMAPPADLNLGGYPVLRLRGTAGGMTPDQRISVILSRVTPLLGNPVILPSDVVVYLPPPKSRYNRYPVIYALGRRLITVDPATVKAAGGGKTPLEVAKLWAARLQQVLPRVNWRPSNAPEPKIPTNPPLTVTTDFAQVGGDPASVTLRGKVILKVRGPQMGGLTAAERADILTARLARLANQPAATAPDAVQVTMTVTGEAALALAGTTLLSVTPQDAAAANVAKPSLLAESWAKNLRAVLTPPAPVPPAPVPPIPTENVPTAQSNAAPTASVPPVPAASVPPVPATSVPPVPAASAPPVPAASAPPVPAASVPPKGG